MRQSIILIGALALCAGFTSSAEAQQIDPTRIIDMHVNAEGRNTAFSARVVEGKRFRMSFDGVGTFELAPVVLNASTFRVTVYRGREGAASEDLTEVESLTARLGVPVAIRSMPRVGLVIDGVSTATTSAASQTSFNFAGMERLRSDRRVIVSDDCCVNCGGIRACGCKVESDCGFCCVAPCCSTILVPGSNIIGPPTTFRRLAGQCGDPIKDEERLFTPAMGSRAIASR